MKLFIIIGIWELVSRLKNILVLTNRWIYKIKKKLNGFILYKAR